MLRIIARSWIDDIHPGIIYTAISFGVARKYGGAIFRWLGGYEDDVPKNLPKSWDLTLEKSPNILLRSEGTLEQETASLEKHLEPLKSQERALEQPLEQGVLISEEPSKGELDKLKRFLGIEKGSMQYKKPGDGVYLAVCNSKRKGYDWKYLGTWKELKNQIA